MRKNTQIRANSCKKGSLRRGKSREKHKKLKR